jgi:hypothetical protein
MITYKAKNHIPMRSDLPIRIPLEPFSKYSVTVLLATVITFTWYSNSALLLYCGYSR